MLHRVGNVHIIDAKSLLIGRPYNINGANQVIKVGPSCGRSAPFADSEDLAKYAMMELAAVILPEFPKLCATVYTLGEFYVTYAPPIVNLRAIVSDIFSLLEQSLGRNDARSLSTNRKHCAEKKDLFGRQETAANPVDDRVGRKPDIFIAKNLRLKKTDWVRNVPLK